MRFSIIKRLAWDEFTGCRERMFDFDGDWHLGKIKNLISIGEFGITKTKHLNYIVTHYKCLQESLKTDVS